MQKLPTISSLQLSRFSDSVAPCAAAHTALLGVHGRLSQRPTAPKRRKDRRRCGHRRRGRVFRPRREGFAKPRGVGGCVDWLDWAAPKIGAAVCLRRIRPLKYVRTQLLEERV